MNLRIANIGIPATHPRITALDFRVSSISISDFDALIFDPIVVGTSITGGVVDLKLRESQVRELLEVKAGVVLALVRPSGTVVGGPDRRYNGYFFLDDSMGGSRFTESIRPGSGVSLSLAPTASSAGRKYFRSLEGHLQFEGYFGVGDISTHARIIATNSVGQVIAAQFNALNGKVLFLPCPSNIGSDRIGVAMFEAVAALLKDDPEVAEPEWSQAILIPGADRHDSRVEELSKKRRELKDELDRLQGEKKKLLNFKHLLFGTGKSTLESAVRSALRLFEFTVPEPEECEGEWDVELHSPDGRLAIAEIEGSEGVVSVDKFRQLLHYMSEEELAGRSHKGILVGNGFRLLEPGSRPNQFSDHTISAALKFEVCLLPTSELFKCVLAVLERPGESALRAEIRGSLLTTSGTWAFAPVPDTKNSAAGG